LVYLQAEDDPNSLNLADSIATLTEKKSNTALGGKGHFSLFKNKIYMDFDGGISFVTENLEAINPEEFQSNIPSFLNANVSSHINYAGTSRLGYRRNKSNYGIEYRYVQDGYESLGLNYLLSDLQQISLNMQTQLFKSRVNFSGSIGLMYNNLSERLAAKTSRNIGSVQLNYAASKRLNINLNYANFSVVQQRIQDLIYNDTLLIDQVNHTLNVSPTYTWTDENKSQSIITTLSYQKLSDNNDFTAQFSENNMNALQSGYNYTSLKTGFGFRLGANYNAFKTTTINQTRYGLSGGLSQSFFKKKLQAGLNTFYSIDDNELKKGSVVSANINLTYKPAAKHSFMVNYNWLNFDSQTVFTEQRGSVGYRWSFSGKLNKKGTKDEDSEGKE